MLRSRTLFAGLFDYAGLFPPASLSLQEAAVRYAGYLRGADSWMLGRFVVPAAQLEYLSPAIADVWTASDGSAPWRISALCGEDARGDAARISAFNGRHAELSGGTVLVDTVEMRVASVDEVRASRVWAGRGFEVFCECPVDRRLDMLLDAVATAGVHAKIRTGGTAPEAFPAPADVARFLCGCMARGIVATATAGLHHAVRGQYPLTYDAGSATTTMHGYLNLVLAAAVAEGAGRVAAQSAEVCAVVERLLSVTTHPAFIGHSHVKWGGDGPPIIEGPLEPFAVSGRALLRSVGTCSFEEPVGDARRLRLVS